MSDDRYDHIEERLNQQDKRIRRLEESSNLHNDRVTAMESALEIMTRRFHEWQGRIENTLTGFTDTVQRLMQTTQNQTGHYEKLLSALERNNQLLTTAKDVTNTWSGVIETINTQVIANNNTVSDTQRQLTTLNDYVDSTDERVGLFASKVNHLEQDIYEDRDKIVTVVDKLEHMSVTVALLDNNVKLLLHAVEQVMGVFTIKNVLYVCVVIGTLVGLDHGYIQDAMSLIEKILGG